MLFEGFILQTFTFLSNIIDFNQVSFHKNVHQFSGGGRDCRQDHKQTLKGCFVSESFKHWQVFKTCIIWIVHGKLLQLLLTKSLPGRLSRSLIKPTLSNFSKRSFRKFQHNFHEQKEKSESKRSDSNLRVLRNRTAPSTQDALLILQSVIWGKGKIREGLNWKKTFSFSIARMMGWGGSTHGRIFWPSF